MERVDRRRALQVFGAVLLASCAPRLESSDQSQNSQPEGNFDSQIASMVKGGFIDLLKTPKPNQNGVEAELLAFDYNDKRNLITAQWKVRYWNIFKEVQIDEIEARNIGILAPDPDNGITLQGRGDVAFRWRHKDLIREGNDWGDYVRDSENFMCQVGKNTECRTTAPTFQHNWPPVGPLYRLVYSKP